MKKQKRKIVKQPTKRTRKKLKLLRSTYHHVRFLPAIIITLVATFLWANPQYTLNFGNTGSGVLAKATNTTVSGLLSGTNAERSAAGISSLKLNSKLNSAAQAKAQHMIKNDYWAHVAPDGTQPWEFFGNAGYVYISAGENLAYGFLTSTSTVNGWMNSPSHKSNMLNKIFTEVGFGIASTDAYVYNGQNHGPQTIVVAHYAKPRVASATATAPSKNTTSSKPAKKKTEPVATVKKEQKKPDTTIAEEAKEQPEEEIAVLDDQNVVVAAPTNVSRVQLLTGGNAIWSASFVTLAVLAAAGLWLIHKGVHVRRWVVAGENFISHHAHIDLTVLSIILLGAVLLTTTVAIR